MNRNDFRQLLKRYVSGTANEQEKALIDSWYELLYNESITALNTNELESIEQEMWNRIELQANIKSTGEFPADAKTPVRKIIIRWAAAAAVITAIVAGIYSLNPTQQRSFSYEQNKTINKLQEINNTTAAIQKIELEDGSTIVLQPSARLAYPTHFSNDKREVYLEGEAFFQVTKNPLKPFLVHSGTLVTQVLGTSFTIKPDKKTNRIIVAVKTGKVAVYEDSRQLGLNSEQQKNNGAIITPNQKVTYDAGSRYFVTSLVDNPEPVKIEKETEPMPASFSFEDKPLSAVLDELSKNYAIEILAENENIYQCRFTGNITQQSLYEKLELICQSTNHTYEIKGTKILIKGKGCN
ncbi:MAG: FecR family protein [Ferruginibacter sp.]